jgi:hypothetical protein
MLQFELPVSHSVRIPAGERRVLHRSVLLGRAAIFGHEENHGLQDSSRSACPCGKGRDGRKEPTGKLHTCLEGEVIEEIRDILE